MASQTMRRAPVLVEPHVASVAARATHRISKDVQSTIRLIAGLGVEGDAHAGVTVKHRSRVAKDPTVPNLRQVHLIHGELLDELAAKGFTIAPASMGENILTRGVDLLGLGRGTRLQFGGGAVVEITGLRNPCHQLNGLALGLMEAVLDRDEDCTLIRKAGVMGIVIIGGDVRAGDPVTIVTLPDQHEPLLPV
jgi:MOSC domain-containing protein YiiM